jgi:hypothetical protein
MPLRIAVSGSGTNYLLCIAVDTVTAGKSKIGFWHFAGFFSMIQETGA